MMKKIVSVGLVGFGMLAAQGCSVEAGDESIASAQDEVTMCLDAQGAKATLAALAVAMGDEVGRWDPVNDLYLVKDTNPWFNYTRLKPGVTCLKNNCAMTKAILGQQNFTVDQNKFSDANFRSTAEQGFMNHKNLLANLQQNSRGQLPPAHKLTLVAGPQNLGTGACGAHYVFQADRLDGTPLNATEANNLKNTLCFFGQNATNGTGCGSNQFIAFQTTMVGCPTGRTCVAIDPDPNDNGTSSTTTSGAGPTYPMNRIYDASNALLGTSCTTTTGKAGKMQSKCSTVPATCGYLYCIAP